VKILLANPNTTDAITQRMAAVAQEAASPGTEIVAVTATTGVPYIATRADAVLGASALLDLLGRHAGGADAVIVAAFGDPGLEAARELLPIPVVGMAEAAMLTACMLGRRFAVVTFATSFHAWFYDLIDHVGLRQRCSGVHCLEEPFSDIASVADEKRLKLVALCQAAVAAGAEACILAGAPLAGLASSIADQVPVPLVDGVAAATRQAETLAVLRPRKASVGGFRRPDPKRMTGISDTVVGLFDGLP
jgi:allantoin racemase